MKRFHCRAILFDLDGVLVDSASYIEAQWRAWAVSRGLAPEPFLKVCHGRRAVETIRLAAPQLDADAEVAAFVPAQSNDIPLKPVEGAVDLLQTLPAGSWAVATSGPREGAVDRLRRTGLPVPAVLICAEDVRRGKPNPDVYLLAAEFLGMTSMECVVVEDAPAGIEAARAAGMSVIGLTTTHPMEQLPADALAASLSSIQVRPLDHAGPGPGSLEVSVDKNRPD
jgi:sugar-phosphatase